MDEGLLRDVTAQPVFTLEEHVRTGGFGATVSQFAAEHHLPVPAKCFALPDAFIPHGSRALLLDKLGLSASSIAADIQAHLHHQE